MTDARITDVLGSLGLNGDVAVRARAMLERAGITNPRKQRISRAKIPNVQAELDTRLHRLCHSCLTRVAPNGREIVQVPSAACSSCGGSANRRAVDEMVAACRRADVIRVVFVGGSPKLRRELEELVARRLELRLVDGTRSSDRATANRDVAWADLIVVMGATVLAHKVSNLYTRDPEARSKLVVTSRRGIAAIADGVTRSDVVTDVRRRRVAEGDRWP